MPVATEYKHITSHVCQELKEHDARLRQTAEALSDRERHLESTLASANESHAQLQSREFDVSGLEKTLRSKYDEMQHLLDDAIEKKQFVAQVEEGMSYEIRITSI